MSERDAVSWRYFVHNGSLMRTDGMEAPTPPRGRCVGPVCTCQQVKRRGCVVEIVADGVMFPKDTADRLIGQYEASAKKKS